MSDQRTRYVAIPVDDIRVAIVEGLLDLTRPKNATAADASADMEARSPGVAEMADRAAHNVMFVLSGYINRSTQ